MKENIKKIKENVEKFGIVKLIIILIVIITIFQAGIFVGYHKARFYNSIGGNYYKPLHDKRGGNNMMQNFDLPGGHGAVGKIVSINLPNIVVASPDNIEKTINISNETIIRQSRNTIELKDLKIGEYVVVLGDFSNPDDGIINAKLIRLIPPPPDTLQPNATTTSTSTSNKI